MEAATLARMERLFRPLLTQLPPLSVIDIYSRGRLDFLVQLKQEPLPESYLPSSDLSRTLWDIHFRSPLMNAAGMFKNGESYPLVAHQGAAAYLGGTGTWIPRTGNTWSKKMIEPETGQDLVVQEMSLPFVPYPRSHAASNWLGLPNDGDLINAYRIKELGRINETPLGWSVMGSPDVQGEEKLAFLVLGMNLYTLFGVDFLEINESCPNTSHGKPQDDNLAARLRYVKCNFLDRRTRRVPVIVKFSNDTNVVQIPYLLDLLFGLGYDGVNFGNTSTNYQQRREQIHPQERKLFDFFTTAKEFGVGGGVSGRPLKESSLELAARAVEYTRAGPPSQEFHVIRTGGIETWQDLQDSERAGISLNQWYTGYFENFSRHGHTVYKKLFENQR